MSRPIILLFRQVFQKKLFQENAALCDLVSEIQDNIIVVKEERKFLLRKLLEHEGTESILKKRPNVDPEAANNKVKITGIKKAKIQTPSQIVIKKQPKNYQQDTNSQVHNFNFSEMDFSRHEYHHPDTSN